MGAARKKHRPRLALRQGRNKGGAGRRRKRGARQGRRGMRPGTTGGGGTGGGVAAAPRRGGPRAGWEDWDWTIAAQPGSGHSRGSSRSSAAGVGVVPRASTVGGNSAGDNTSGGNSLLHLARSASLSSSSGDITGHSTGHSIGQSWTRRSKAMLGSSRAMQRQLGRNSSKLELRKGTRFQSSLLDSMSTASTSTATVDGLRRGSNSTAGRDWRVSLRPAAAFMRGLGFHVGI